MEIIDHPLAAERRERRSRDLRRCLAVAINAETELVTAFMIDEALRLATVEAATLITPLPETVNAAASY